MPPASSSPPAPRADRPTAASLTARKLTVERGGEDVLVGVDLTVSTGDRIGVVGANGSGKSTLLAALAGRLTPDAGTVTLAPPTASIGLLGQEPDLAGHADVAALLAHRTGVAAAHAELDAATGAMAADTEGAADRYSSALERWLGLGAADLDARIGQVWDELGLDAALLAADPTRLSGGQAARVSLAALLLSRFDILLLDEPTNDLDHDGLDRLATFVAGATVPVVLVSHDRWFLEATVTDVLDVHEHHHTARRYGGGWSAYVAERAVAARHESAAYDLYVRRRDDLTARARRQREWSVRGARRAVRDPRDPDKFTRHFNTQSSERQAAKARATERAIERLDPVTKPWEGWQLHLEVARAERSGDDVARLSAAVIRRGDVRLGPLDVAVSWGERIAVAGPNGSGKSTLLAALLGQLPLVAGSHWLGPGVVVGELDQARRRFDGGRPLIDAFVDVVGVDVRTARSTLAKFGLDAGHVARPTSQLSPGERTRASLAHLMAAGCNLLVLDEPTNHLDLPAIEQLEAAVGRWDGTLLLVTHDRRFAETVRVDRTISMPELLGGTRPAPPPTGPEGAAAT